MVSPFGLSYICTTVIFMLSFLHPHRLRMQLGFSCLPFETHSETILHKFPQAFLKFAYF